MADPDHTSSEAETAAEWSPAELDRLEDALERWTAEDAEAVQEDSSLSPRMRERLASYRDLMTMSRAEMAMEDVPEGLLAGVLAEAARGGSTAQREVKVATAGRAQVGFWERLRRSMLLPGVALAGSAALLLWVVQPGEPPHELQATNTAPARLAPGPSPAPAASQEPEPGGVAEAVEAEKEARIVEEAPAAAPSLASRAEAEDAMKESKPADSKGAAGGRSKAKKSEMPGAPVEYLAGLEEVPTDAGADKDELRDTLELADKARRKGRCGDAIKIYRSAMEMSGPRDEQAQAWAGYALCLQSQGDDAKADTYFDAASKISPSIDGWVKRERGEGSPKKAPAKPSAKVSLDDPFK